MLCQVAYSRAKVRTVFDAIAAGQIQASGTLVDYGARVESGRVLALIDVDDFQVTGSRPVLPRRSLYTDHWYHVSLLRKILLRMRSRENYVFVEGN